MGKEVVGSDKLNIRLLKDEFENMWIIIFKDGKMSDPNLVLYGFEFEILIKEYEKKKKELTK